MATKSKCPLPVRITLRNQVRRDNASKEKRSNHYVDSVNRFSCLSGTLLEIQEWKGGGGSEESAEGDEEDEEEDRLRVIERFTHKGAFQPEWDLLYEGMSEECFASVETYKSLSACIVSDDEERRIIADIPLYPQHLYTLECGIPEELPANTLVVEFTDGSTRVGQEVYELLAHRGLVDGRKERRAMPGDDLAGVRFSDDVFDMLEKSSVKDGENGRGREDVDDSLFADDLFELLGGVASPPGDDVDECSEETPDEPNYHADECVGEAEEPLRKLTNEYARQEEEVRYLRQELLFLEQLYAHEESQHKKQRQLFTIETDRLQSLLNSVKDVKHQTDLLQLEAQKEISELQNSQILLQSRQTQLIRSLSSIYPITSRTENDNTTRYFIRAIELPLDIITASTYSYSSYYSSSSTFTDDQISTGLGYTCHLVSMISHYLDVPLRYTLISNASRSAVQDGESTFPLFRLAIDKELFERAIALLDRNIDAVLRHVGLKLSTGKENQKIHMLKKLDVFFQWFERVDSNGDVGAGHGDELAINNL